VPRRQLAALSGYQVIVGFTVMWSPVLDRGRSPWRSWTDYLRAWRAVRAEYRQRYPHRQDAPFAARASALARDRGVAALEQASLEEIRSYGCEW